MQILIRWMTTPLLLMTPIDLFFGVVEIFIIYLIPKIIKLGKEVYGKNERKNRKIRANGTQKINKGTK